MHEDEFYNPSFDNGDPRLQGDLPDLYERVDPKDIEALEQGNPEIRERYRKQFCAQILPARIGPHPEDPRELMIEVHFPEWGDILGLPEDTRRLDWESQVHEANLHANALIESVLYNPKPLEERDPITETFELSLRLAYGTTQVVHNPDSQEYEVIMPVNNDRGNNKYADMVNPNSGLVRFEKPYTHPSEIISRTPEETILMAKSDSVIMAKSGFHTGGSQTPMKIKALDLMRANPYSEKVPNAKTTTFHIERYPTHIHVRHNYSAYHKYEPSYSGNVKRHYTMKNSIVKLTPAGTLENQSVLAVGAYPRQVRDPEFRRHILRAPLAHVLNKLDDPKQIMDRIDVYNGNTGEREIDQDWLNYFKYQFQMSPPSQDIFSYLRWRREIESAIIFPQNIWSD